MKTFKLFLAAAVFPSLIAILIGLSGCEKETPEQMVPIDQSLILGKHHRTVNVTDGTNKVTLEIASDDPAALADFEAGLTMKASTEPAIFTPSETATQAEPASDLFDDSKAVHIAVVGKELAPSTQGFVLQIGRSLDQATNKITYQGGPYYFYSWEAPHYFRVTPNGACVSAWLQQAGSTWTYCSWAGGSGGNYLCSNSWAASSNVNSLDYRLKAQGANFSVYWY